MNKTNDDKRNLKKKPAVKTLGYHHYQKADALRLHSLFKESIQYYLKCIFLERTNKKAYIGLAMAYKQLKDYDRAVEVLEKAKKLDNKNSKVDYEIGICFILKGCPCRAVGYLRSAIQQDVNNINAQVQLAIAHELLDEPEIALAMYHSIIEKHPKYISAYSHLAALYMNFEEYMNAACVFKQILKLVPNDCEANLGIGVCFERMDKLVDAIRYYRRYCASKQGEKDFLRIKEKISKLKSSLPKQGPVFSIV